MVSESVSEYSTSTGVVIDGPRLQKVKYFMSSIRTDTHTHTRIQSAISFTSIEHQEGESRLQHDVLRTNLAWLSQFKKILAAMQNPPPLLPPLHGEKKKQVHLFLLY